MAARNLLLMGLRLGLAVTTLTLRTGLRCGLRFAALALIYRRWIGPLLPLRASTFLGTCYVLYGLRLYGRLCVGGLGTGDVELGVGRGLVGLVGNRPTLSMLTAMLSAVVTVCTSLQSTEVGLNVLCLHRLTSDLAALSVWFSFLRARLVFRCNGWRLTRSEVMRCVVLCGLLGRGWEARFVGVLLPSVRGWTAYLGLVLMHG